MAVVVEVDVTEADFKKSAAILGRDDRDFQKRFAILKEKQKKHPEWRYIEALKGHLTAA